MVVHILDYLNEFFAITTGFRIIPGFLTYKTGYPVFKTPIPTYVTTLTVCFQWQWTKIRVLREPAGHLDGFTFVSIVCVSQLKKNR